MSKKIAIVMPVLDDWDTFAALVTEISGQFAGSGIILRFYAVDDGSLERFEPTGIRWPIGSSGFSLEVIRLAANLGHQRAIAVGLCAVVEDGWADTLLVMDSDGQDRPADIERLLAVGARHPEHVVLAARTRRAEPCTFRFWYRLYRLLFRAVTGHAINFGNFCLIPISAARRLVYMPDLWNNLACAVMRSRLPSMAVPTVREKRSCGRSKMNLPGLIVHGLSAMSVYSDVIFARLLLATGGTAVSIAFGIVMVVVIQRATEIAVAGWTTPLLGDLLIILLQTFVVVIAASLTLLAGRNSRPIVPISDCSAFIAARESWGRKPNRAVIGLAQPAA